MRARLFVFALILIPGVWAVEPELHCVKNWGEWTWEGMKFHRYHLQAEHFPPNKQYRLIVESFNGVRTETFNFISNKKGHLILVRPDEDYKDEIYAICPAKRGERLTFWMKSEEDAYCTELVPFPLEMRSKKGIKLNLELRGENGEKFLLFVEELEAYEEIELTLVVDEKQVSLTAREVNEYGELTALIDLPIDSHGGDAKLIVKRKKEQIVFPFHWGVPALKIVGACCFEIN
jgi:hypothetical protein